MMVDSQTQRRYTFRDGLPAGTLAFRNSLRHTRSLASEGG
jgi:hypothetical protein